jgi:hypothetical protein
MKFTVEVEEFYLDEDENLAPALVKEITRNVIDGIWGQIKDKVDKAITIAVETKIQKELTLQINLRVAELINAGTITKDKKEVLISDWIKEQFDRSSGWNTPYDQIKNIAANYGQEMKKRYDYFYANQIVTQMSKIGILKEEIFKKLIDVDK